MGAKEQRKGRESEREEHKERGSRSIFPLGCHTVDDVQLVDNDSSSLAWIHWIVRVCEREEREQNYNIIFQCQPLAKFCNDYKSLQHLLGGTV